MNGRMFGGQSVEAYIADGSERFEKSKQKSSVLDNGDDEEKRLDKFGAWLETAQGN